MIAYFPTIYEDELIYSAFARCYAHSGYEAYSYFAQNFYANPKQRTDIEFYNPLLKDVFSSITENNKMDALVMKHTMFPYYCHFLNNDKKLLIYNSLCSNSNDYKSLITYEATGIQRYLKYCPFCAYEDRTTYGEAFWHRSHQINNLNICHKHFCKLKETTITLSAKVSPFLHLAETNIPYAFSNVEIQTDAMIKQFVSYVYTVFNTEVEFAIDNKLSLGKFLHARLFDTKYVSVRGEQRNISLLYEDLKNYYSSSEYEQHITKERLMKLFTNHRSNFIEVCLLAFFLKIPIVELCARKEPITNQIQEFDNSVLALHNSGVGYNKIAKELGVSSSTVREIINIPTKNTTTRVANNPGVHSKDWSSLDEQYLSSVLSAIKQLQSYDRPRKVTVFAITKILGLPDKTIYKLPMCLLEIEKYSETQIEFWSRELLWAYQNTKHTGDKLQWTSLRRRTNLRRSNAIKCLPILDKIGSSDAKELCKIIQSQ